MLNASNKFLIRFLINQVQKFYVSIRSSNPTSSSMVSPLVQVLFVIAMTSSTMMVMENKTTIARIIGLSSTILSMCSFAVGIGLAIYVAHEKINLLSFPMKLLPTKRQILHASVLQFQQEFHTNGVFIGSEDVISPGLDHEPHHKFLEVIPHWRFYMLLRYDIGASVIGEKEELGFKLENKYRYIFK